MELKDLVTIIQNGGPTALATIMAVLWWLERSERRELQKERDALLERVLTAMNTSSDAVKTFRRLIGRGNPDE